MNAKNHLTIRNSWTQYVRFTIAFLTISIIALPALIYFDIIDISESVRRVDIKVICPCHTPGVALAYRLATSKIELERILQQRPNASPLKPIEGGKVTVSVIAASTFAQMQIGHKWVVFEATCNGDEDKIFTTIVTINEKIIHERVITLPCPCSLENNQTQIWNVLNNTDKKLY